MPTSPVPSWSFRRLSAFALAFAMAVVMAIVGVGVARAQTPAPDDRCGGTWWEELAWASRSGDTPSNRVRAEVMRTGGAPELAVMRVELSDHAELEDFQRFLLADALQRERLELEVARAARVPRPADTDRHALATWLYLHDDVSAAADVVAALPDDDNSTEAVVLRFVAAAHAELGLDEVVAAYEAARAEAKGPCVALGWNAEFRLQELAARERFQEEMSLSGGNESPYEAPSWARVSHPSEESLAISTSRDAVAMRRHLEAARAVPANAPERDTAVWKELELASRVDVLASEPWFEIAAWFLRRGDHAQALEAVDVGLRRDPASATGWRLRTIACEEAGDTRAALVSAERALELAPGDPWLERAHVGALVRLGLLDEASVAGRESRLSDPESPWNAITEVLTARESTTSVDRTAHERRLERFLDDPDDRVRLWSAVAACVARKSVDGRAGVVLTTLRSAHEGQPLGRAARAVLDDVADEPTWGGFARLVRGDAAGAVARWVRDAAGSGDGAMAARGLLTSCRGRMLWPAVPELPDFASEAPIVLPDLGASAVRVPVEAPDVARALEMLPPYGRRVVLARGTYVVPEHVSRGMDLVGLGDLTRVRPATGDTGGIVFDAGSAGSLRVSELTWDAYANVKSGQLLVRRVESSGAWWVGQYDKELPTSAWFDDVTLHAGVTVHGRATRARFDRCVFDDPLSSSVPVSVFLARAELVGCLLQQSQSYNGVVHVGGKEGHVAITDGRMLGHVLSNGVLRTAVVVNDGATAHVVRTRIVDLEPPVSAGVTAEACHFQRTAKQATDSPGWKAHGRAPSARREDLAPLRVPEDHATLAEAIVAAEPGRIVRLSRGVHSLPAAIEKDVVIVGEETSQTAIQVVGENAGLVVRDACVVLRDLTLVGSGLTVFLETENRTLPLAVGETEPGAVAPPLATIVNGSLSFGANARIHDPRGRWFDVGDGGAVTGRLGVWLLDPDVRARIQGDGVLGTEIDLKFRRWIEDGVSWSGTAPGSPRDAHRPFALAFDRRPEEALATVRVARLARVDDALQRGWPVGGPEFLADALNRVYALSPADQRTDAMLARAAPRFEALAKQDARNGVEQLITVAMIGVGGSTTIDEAFSTTRRLVQGFLDHVPAEHLVYVKSRLKGMDAAQADATARRALCLEAYAAGRVDQCLALIDSVSAAERAAILLTTEPKRLSYSEISVLLRAEGLTDKTASRLRILQSSLFAIRPSGPPPLPSAWTMIHAYIDANTSGVANKYFAFREVDTPSGWRTETVMRPEYVPSAPEFRAPYPEAPKPGAPESDWDRFYAALEVWSRS